MTQKYLQGKQTKQESRTEKAGIVMGTQLDFVVHTSNRLWAIHMQTLSPFLTLLFFSWKSPCAKEIPAPFPKLLQKREKMQVKPRPPHTPILAQSFLVIQKSTHHPPYGASLGLEVGQINFQAPVQKFVWKSSFQLLPTRDRDRRAEWDVHTALYCNPCNTIRCGSPLTSACHVALCNIILHVPCMFWDPLMSHFKICWCEILCKFKLVI